MNKLLFAVLALASIGAANAQVKLAVINTQKALLDTEEIKKAQADMEARFKPRQDQMIKLQKELEDIQAQLNSGRLNEAGSQDMQAEGPAEAARLTAHAAGFAGRRAKRAHRNPPAGGQPDAGRGEEAG